MQSKTAWLLFAGICLGAGILSFTDNRASALKAADNGKSNSRRMASTLENLVKERVVPDVIDAKPPATIHVKYPSGVEVLQGNELTPTQVKDLPTFSFDAVPDQLYTLVKVDLDAPSRADPKFREILHYMVANIPGNNVPKGETLAEYVGSGAPKGTGLHRYVYVLYHQKDGRLRTDMKIPKTSRAGRVSFNLRKFAKTNNLGAPIAANFYQAQYDDYVPILHAQLSTGVPSPMKSSISESSSRH